MRIVAPIAAALAVVGVVACRHSGPAAIRPCDGGERPAAASLSPAAWGPFVGVVQPAPDASAMLARFEPRSLRALSREVEVGEYHRAWSISPDGRQVALGVSAGGSTLEPSQPGRGRIGIYIVDLKAMELVREVHTGVAAVALGWLGPRRLVAALQRGGTVLVDPLTGSIVRRWPQFSFPDASAQMADALVLLLPKLRESALNVPLTRVSGPPRLAVVDADGRLRSVTLERIPLGVRTIQDITYEDRAGLAVDRARARAYVVAADAPVAEIDLGTMRVSYHQELAQPPGSGEPVQHAPQRRALWIGDGKLAVFGVDYIAAGGEEVAARPAGVTMIDTGDWGACVLDERAGAAVLTAGQLLTYSGMRSTPRRGALLGVRAYRIGGGSTTFHVLRDQPVWDVDLAGDHAYLRTAEAMHVLDIPSGSVVAAAAQPLEIIDVVARAR